MSGHSLNPDGPHSDEYTRHVASVFAGTVRILNHATRDQDGVTEPATVHAILGELHDGIARLDQLLQQLDRKLVQFDGDDLADSDGIPAWSLGTARAIVLAARSTTADLAGQLAGAHTATSGLYLRNGGDA